MKYSTFHSSLPFEHLGKSSLCKPGNLLFYFRTETVSQVFLKFIQHLSLDDDVISSDKNIVIVWLKHILLQNSLHKIYNAF